MSSWVKQRGISVSVEPEATRLLGLFLAAMDTEDTAQTIIEEVFKEAVFRKYELPKRSPEFQRKYLKV